MESRARIRIEYPDDDLRQRISSFLGSRHFPAFRSLQVGVQNGSVTISGTVCSFYEKQVALDSCRRVAGVLSMIDRIVVSPVGEDDPLGVYCGRIEDEASSDEEEFFRRPR